MRIRRTIALAAVGSLSLAACSSGSQETASTPVSSAPAASGGELVIWADPKRAEALAPFGQEFGAANGVEVKIETISEDLQTNFVTASQAGSAPDVVVGAHDWIGNLVQNGAIDPVQLADPAAFSPTSISAVTFNGQVYGTPYAVENVALICNTDLVPAAPTTVEELVATGKALVDDGKADQILVQQVGQNGDVYHMQPLLTSAGGGLFGVDASGTVDPTQVIIDSPESIAAMEKIAALGEEGAGALTRSIGAENAIATFTAGKAPCIITGPWAIADIEKAGIPYDINPIPGFEGGTAPAPFIGTQAFYVASKGDNKALAQEFVTNYAATPEVQVALYEAEPRRPALLAAQEIVAAKDPNLTKFEQAGANGVPLPAIPQMAAIWDPVGKAQAAIVGGADVTTALTAAADAVRQQIDG